MNQNLVAGILGSSYAVRIGADIGGTIQDSIRRTSDHGPGGVAHGDHLDGIRAIAALINCGPGTSDDFSGATVIGYRIQKADGDLAAGVLGGSNSGDIRSGISRTFQGDISGTKERRPDGVAHGDRLNTTDDIAAGIGGRPGTGDDFSGAA